MAGTKSGGMKAKETNLAKNPNFYIEIGRMGGKAPYTGLKGFAADPELAREVGRKGGYISRRKAKVNA